MPRALRRTQPLRHLSAAALRGGALFVAFWCPHAADAQATGPGATLRPFGDDAQLAAYHRELVEILRNGPRRDAAAAPMAGERSTGDARVRAHGDDLVVLRDGRVSTLRVAEGALEAVSMADVLGPGGAMGDAVSRELLVDDDGAQVVAVGDGGRLTHVVRYRWDAEGRLAYRDGVHIRATGGPYAGVDAIRAVDGGVVMIHRLEIPVDSADAQQALPSAWSAADADSGAQVTATPQRVYPSVYPMYWTDEPVLSTVTVCRGPDRRLECTSTAVYTPEPEVVHVSPTAVYLWTLHRDAIEPHDGAQDRQVLYRLPLDGSAPTALPVSGAPQRPEAFMESADGHLNVGLLFDGWTEESYSLPPTLALLRVPLSAFGDGHGPIVREHYRELPRMMGRQLNRFVGEWMLYGTRPHSDDLVNSGLIAQAPAEALGIGRVRWAGGDTPRWLGLRMPVLALQTPRPDAAFALVGHADTPGLMYLRLADSIHASGILRFGIHHPDGMMSGIAHHSDGPDAGLLAVPIGAGPDEHSWRARELAVLRYDAAGIRQIGALAPRTEPAGSREVVPIFAHGRLFALLGDELVEAVEENGALREVRRIPLP